MMSEYQNMPVCDLRHLTDPKAVREIEEISNIAFLIYPKTNDPELQAAFAAIPTSNIASVIFLDTDKSINVQMINGGKEFTETDFPEERESIYIINGIGYIPDLSREIRGEIYCNGMLVIQKKVKELCHLSFPMMNGMIKYLDFDDVRLYPNEMALDSETITYFQNRTLVVGGNLLRLEKDVTVELLQQKELMLIVGNCLECYPPIAPYIKATATVGNQIKVIQDQE